MWPVAVSTVVTSCVVILLTAGCAAQSALTTGLRLPADYQARVRLQPSVSRELVESIAGGVWTERLDANVTDVIIDASGAWRIGLQPEGVQSDEARWWLVVEGANSSAATGGWTIEAIGEGPPHDPAVSRGNAGRLEPPFSERDPVTLVRYARWDPQADRIRESVLVTRRTMAGPSDSDPDFVGVDPSELLAAAEPGDDVLLAFGEAPAPAPLLAALTPEAQVSPSTELVYLEARRDSRSCLRLTEHFRFLLGPPPTSPLGLPVLKGLTASAPQTASGPQSLAAAPVDAAPQRPVAPGESAEVRSSRHRWVFRAIEFSSPAEEDSCKPPAGRRAFWLLVLVGAATPSDATK